MLMNKRKYPSVLGVAGKVADLEKKAEPSVVLEKNFDVNSVYSFYLGNTIVRHLESEIEGSSSPGSFP